jgi:hypothetical protein
MSPHMSQASPPSLAAVVSPMRGRCHRVKVSLLPSEHQVLAQFAAQAQVAPATLARALLQASLRQIAEEQAAMQEAA